MNFLWKQALLVFTSILISLLTIQPNEAQALSTIQKPISSPNEKQQSSFIITVRSGQQAAFVSDLRIESREMNAALRQAKQAPASAAEVDVFSDIYITLLSPEATYFRLERSGQLWDETKMERTILPTKMAEKLIGLAEAVRSQHYGKLLSWQQSTQILPNKSIFSVTELETGLTFNVQRRAGSDHADVQPLTKDDSRIMKQIYNGRWSWKRKAVLIHSGDAWIAASMNGMPHGGDGIPENGFSGHFCIHFYLSSTHKSDLPDLAHQIMVHKAAGNLKPFFDSASPLVLAKSFIEIMNHQDQGLLQQVAEGISKEKFAYFVKEMESLDSIREKKQSKYKGASDTDDGDFDESLSAEIRLPITIHKQNHAERNTGYRFIFKRESKQSPWRIQNILTDEDNMDSNIQ
ncbi:hypothetical protein [Paenibacillus sp. LHD-38]|uniref:hypothetical protein n=1 Tax=Paenibacillus sp. LHD-38 TaxID=3072143 RepID=UPI00280E07BB|nr:hypothetical protein [Paenibacillus sp. LHD-38]MDQ8736974.1 hypothetical protein [Paenibacillus sp. LHD-38]